MNITVFGATGQVGKQLVKQALWKKHTVTAFGRNVFTTEFLKDDHLHLIQGALFDEQDVFHSLKNTDAVLSSLGGDFSGSDKTRSLGMKNIITQMAKSGVKRIIGIGGMGILQSNENTLLIDTEDYPKQYIPVGKEHQKAWEFLAASKLDWTFVCPPDILDEEATGSFITRADYPPEPDKYKITAGDLAMFMINELEKNEFVGHRVGITAV